MVIETVISRQETIIVGIGELRVAQFPTPIIACIGLGSCIAVCAYDRTTKIGGVAHVVLPSSNGKETDRTPKYADVAVPLLLSEISRLGGYMSRTVIKIAGGAQMSLAAGTNDAFKTGERNVAGVMEALGKMNMSVSSADTGGHKGRTVHMYLDTGRITVRTVGGEGREI